MKLKAVRIIHNVITRIDFCYLAEFFRFAGIYVVEYIDGDTDISPYQEDRNCFDITIDTCGSQKALEDERYIDFRRMKSSYHFSSNIHRWNKMNQKMLLDGLLLDIMIQLRENRLSRIWQILVNNYVEYVLVIHSMNLQYYFKNPSSVIEEAQKVFYNVYHSLSVEHEIMEKGLLDLRHLEYAQLYCKVKVNAGCKFMMQKFQFPIEELGKECSACANKYPDFSNLKVLHGLCYEYEPIYAPIAISAFLSALQDINMNCYSSHIYYWIGKQYEAYHENWNDAVKSYKFSYDRKHKYKNQYKLAVADRVAGEYLQAIDRFNWIIEKLQNKIRLKMTDPLELEYYFKSKAMIAIIYFNDLKDYPHAIEHAEYLINVYDKLVDESRFYFEFYGDFEADYKKLTKKRFHINKVRSILYYSYHYLGMEERATQYLNMGNV